MKSFVTFLLLCLACGLCSAAEPFCNWDHPGHNKYRGTPEAALKDYYLDYQVRVALQAKIETHQYDDIVEIRRDGVTGSTGTYSNLRDMHYGKGHFCPGRVDTGAWSTTQVERALVYCEGTVCVAVPTVCNNVSLIDRDSPIDVEPAAGLSGGTPQSNSDQGSGEPGPQPGAALPQGQGSPVASEVPEAPGDSWTGFPSVGGGSGGWGGDEGGTPIGSLGCSCIPPPPCGPIWPVVPIPPVTSVPETPEWVMIIAGLACFLWLWNRRQR